MRSARRGFRPALAVAAGALVVTAIAVPARDARADEVLPTGKGITGGALMGAESVTIVASIAGLRTGWVYGVAAAVGAAGGGVGGYFVEQGSTDGVAPTAMLAGGLALIIPALVLYLNGTRYQPEEGAAEDRVPAGPPAEPGVPGAGVTTAPPSPAAPPPPHRPHPRCRSRFSMFVREPLSSACPFLSCAERLPWQRSGYMAHAVRENFVCRFFMSSSDRPY